MTPKDQVALGKVLGEAIRNRLNGLAPGAQRVEALFPAPVVQNRVETPEVHVVNEVTAPPAQVTVAAEAPDLTPLAAALDRQSEAIALLARAVDRQTEVLGLALAAQRDESAHHAEMLSQLVRGLEEMKPPVVRVSPRISVPEPPPPSVTVQAPAAPPRPKRRLEIVHDDGTRSVVIEQ